MISPADIFNGNILLVDDQPVNLLLLEKMLRAAGYVSIASTTDPTEVYSLHRKSHFDLIMLDLQMPGMDGFQVMEELKTVDVGSYLPVLVVTAQPDHKLRALKAGAKDFVSKPFDVAEVLLRVHNMLEVRLLHREMKTLYERVVAEQRLSDRLIHNVLPHSIVERLKKRPAVLGEPFDQVIADRFDEVTVLFVDIVGFTQFSESVSAESLVEMLNDIFTRFDSIGDKRGVEKIKTIGDAYMAAAGLPIAQSDHATRAAHAALDILECMAAFNESSPHKLQVRIGIDSGPAVAGVIGKHKFVYDLWGNTVNTASRMESHGVAGRIHLTDSTRKRLGQPFVLEDRGVIDVKGKGEMNTWFLNGRDG